LAVRAVLSGDGGGSTGSQCGAAGRGGVYPGVYRVYRGIPGVYTLPGTCICCFLLFGWIWLFLGSLLLKTSQPGPPTGPYGACMLPRSSVLRHRHHHPSSVIVVVRHPSSIIVVVRSPEYFCFVFCSSYLRRPS